jgi:hypothetical protein
MSDEERRRHERAVREGDERAVYRLSAWHRRLRGAVSAQARDDLYLGTCAYCDRDTLVGRESSRTVYTDQSLNVDKILCAPCAREHHDHWDEAWDSYYGGLL